MKAAFLFALLSIPLIILSWKTLFNLKSHGFYRFFSWECIVWLFISNYPFWFDNPLGLKQIVSWSFLLVSIYLVVDGVILMKTIGKPKTAREENSLYEFEKTTQLVDQGIFKYIRHPLYSSLLFLTWGIFLKNTTGLLFLTAILSTIFLFLTAITDEKECINFFGEKYIEYMKRSKRFVPFLI
jgi:protein-S-isoprenylcysteine O-methyltransferase Ste14